MAVVSLKSYSLGEEIAHAISHGLAAVAALVGLGVLLWHALQLGDPWHAVTGAVFGMTMTVLYTASTLYHAVVSPQIKRVLRVIDHCAIFGLIAGTYTPFMVGVLRSPLGYIFCIVIWGVALVGMVATVFCFERFRKLSVVMYVAMGWVCLAAARTLFAALDTRSQLFLVAGGLAYTAGVPFYVWKRLPYHHAVWHLFVVAGSVFHYFAVLWAMGHHAS
jgi:hemolysin III